MIDLKSIGNKYILWMVCAFTMLVKGTVLNEKCLKTMMKELHGTWGMDLGNHTVEFWFSIVEKSE